MIEVEPITIETGGHVVHFYERDEDLITTVGGYLAASVGVGEPTLVIATGDHREALATHLVAAGIDVAEARRIGTFVTVDAATTLARFYVDGHIDAAKFHSVVGGTIRHVVEQSGRPVRCFGEMVALLWDAGAVAAALELEGLWNDLGRELAFSLLCGYPNHAFADDELPFARWDLGHLHSGVVDTRRRAKRRFGTRQPGAAQMSGTFVALTALSQAHLTDEVHQATGMVARHLEINTAEALNRLRSHATDHGKTLDEVADEVIDRRLWFDDRPTGPQ